MELADVLKNTSQVINISYCFGFPSILCFKPPYKFVLFPNNWWIFSILFGFYKVAAGNSFDRFSSRFWEPAGRRVPQLSPYSSCALIGLIYQKQIFSFSSNLSLIQILTTGLYLKITSYENTPLFFDLSFLASLSLWGRPALISKLGFYIWNVFV